MKISTKVLPSQSSLLVAERAGFRAVEFWTSAELLTQAHELIEISRKFEFEYVIHFPNGGKLPPELLQNVVDMYDQLHCRAMVMHHPMHERYAEDLLAINPSLRLGVENLKLDVPQFDDWAERQSWLTLDVEHLWKFTLEDAPLATLLEKLESFLAKHIDKLVHVHMPGYLPGQEEHRPMYCSRDLVLAAFSLFQDAGYREFVVSEVNAEFQTECDLKMDLLLLERWQQTRAESSTG